MGGSSQSVGVRYRLAWQHMLCLGPCDAFTEFRGADKQLWKGRATGNTGLVINAPKVWGGDKDQGGVVGTLRLMFGEADQAPSSYMVSVFGPKTPAYRGFMSVVWEGGVWGANNPWAQKASYRVERTYAGWDDDDCWYRETVRVPLDSIETTQLITANVVLDANSSTPDGDGVGFDFTLQGAGVLVVELGPGSDAWSYTPSDDYDLVSFPRTWTNRFGIRNLDTGAVVALEWLETYLTAAAARAAHTDTEAEIPISVAGTYRFFLYDAVIDDNRGHSSHRLSFRTSGSRIAKNPAHMILERHTQMHAGRQPRSSVNLDHLTIAADWFYARGFGLCTFRNSKEESPREYIKRIEKVAGCSLTQSLADGQWYLDIANGVYDLDSLPVITDDDILKFTETATVTDNAVNSVSVKYFDPERNETIITPPVRAMGLVAQFGEIHQTFEFPEIPIGRIAVEVATRELLARITPTRAFEFDCKPTVYALRKNQYVRLQLPKRGIADMVCLVGTIPTAGKLKSGAFQITLTQDIYSLPSTVYTEVELGDDPRPPTEPAELVDEVAFEAPYIDVLTSMRPADFAALPDDAGYVVAAASNPGRMRGFAMLVAPDGGEYVEVDEGDFCPACTLTGRIAPGLQNGIGFTNAKNMAAVQVGDMALLGEELVRVDAIDLDANTINLGRGCGDTLPDEHLAGSVILFYQYANGFDRAQHIAGETLQVKLLTNSVSREMDPADAEPIDVTCDYRIARPYPGGDYRLDGISIYEIGTATPGGGGGGGGSVPPNPPAEGPDHTPASDVPGPHGGYPDDVPYHIPPPAVFDTNLIPGGGTFNDPALVLGWRKRDRSALSEEWDTEEEALRFTGGGMAEGYLYEERFSFPPAIPGTKYTVTFRGTLETPPGVVAQIGIGRGYVTQGELPADVEGSISAPVAYPLATEVEVTLEFVTANNFIIANVVPFVRFTPSSGYSYIGKLSLVDYQVSVVEPTMIDASPANADLSAGLTGVTQRPIVPGFSPSVVVSGGELKATTIYDDGQHQIFIWDDPISGITDVGQIIEVGTDAWSNSTATISGVTYMGVALGIASKLPGGDFITTGLSEAQRGDWTPRKYGLRVPIDPATTGVTYHMVHVTTAEEGKTSGFRNSYAKVSTGVVLP